MNILSTFAIAVGLSMDNFAVTIASGCASRGKVSRLHVLETGIWFVFAHIIMLSAGWFGGHELGRFIDSWDHWIACGVLVFIGIRMILEVRQTYAALDMENHFSRRLIAGLAVATSLDALGVGIALSLEQVSFVFMLGAMSACVLLTSCAGFWLGGVLGERFGKVMEICGGLTLMVIGIKVLLNGLGIW